VNAQNMALALRARAKVIAQKAAGF